MHIIFIFDLSLNKISSYFLEVVAQERCFLPVRKTNYVSVSHILRQ